MKFLHPFFLFLFVAAVAQGEMRISGSDLLDSEFAEALADYAESRDVELAAEFTGSYPGIEALKKEQCDLSIVGIPDGAPMPDDKFRTVYLASKIVAVAVPPENPLNQITMRQLAAIFGEAEASNITNWGQLGLTGQWASRSISLRSVSQSEHTLALDLFRFIALESRNMRRNVTQSPDIESIRQAFQQDNTGIALLHRVPDDVAGLKILPIARSEEDLARPPTPATVSGEEYPLRLPLYLVFQSDRGSELKEILRFAVSDEATEAIVASDLVPLPEQQRQRLLLEFERL